jgi:hypothetical protein
VFNSAEPLAEHLGKLLAQLGWYPGLVAEAVNLFGSTPKFQIDVPETAAPETFTIPEPLKDIVVYEADKYQLTLFGNLAPSEWNTLSDENSSDTDAVAAIEKLKKTVQAALQQLQHRLQSFDLPSVSVECALTTPPIIPTSMNARCYYDSHEKKITFVGWMTADEKQQLQDLPSDILQKIKDGSDGFKEPPGLNQFLTISDLETLLIHGQTFELHLPVLLEKLAPWFYRTQIVTYLGPVVDLEPLLVRALLSTYLDPAKTINAWLDPAFLNSDARVKVTASAFPQQMQALIKFRKAALICSKLRVKLSELSWLPESKPQVDGGHTFATLLLNSLPAAQDDGPAKFLDLQGLLQLFELRDRPQVGRNLIETVLKQVNANQKTTLHQEIAKALQITDHDVGECADNRLKLHWPTSYLEPTKLLPLIELLLTVQKLGIEANKVFSLTMDVPGTNEAIIARNVLRARFDSASWPEQLKPIVDVLRDKQRAALVTYLVQRDHLRDGSVQSEQPHPARYQCSSIICSALLDEFGRRCFPRKHRGR